MMGSMKMGKKNPDVARRAWDILRLALLWARKGGVFKRRLMTELRLLPKFVRSLGQDNTTPRGGIRYRYSYGERQLSFDKTPIFPSVKFNGGGGGSSSMRFLHIPCLNPPAVDFDYEFDGEEENDNEYDAVYARKSFLSIKDEEEVGDDQNPAFNEELENIDSRAEEFIAKFYEQMKMQRQISYLQYNN